MNKQLMYWLFALYSLIMLIILLISLETLTSKLNDIFIASIGMLTFLSIFYGFTISKGSEILNSVRDSFVSQKEELMKNIKKLSTKDEKNLFKEIGNIKAQCDNINSFIDYLNLNKWLFIGVLSYSISIAFYLSTDSQPWTAYVQVVSFWIGFFSNLLIVGVWFAANLIHHKISP